MYRGRASWTLGDRVSVRILVDPSQYYLYKAVWHRKLVLPKSNLLQIGATHDLNLGDVSE